MTNLQKDQAIYQAMCEIGEKYFNRAIESSEEFRSFMAEKCVATYSELKKERSWQGIVHNIVYDNEEVAVDTFRCSFKGDNVFRLMQHFKSLARGKGEYAFTYEEDIPNERIGSVDVEFDDPSSAKKLADYLDGDELRPYAGVVLTEVNALTGAVTFVAANGKVLGVISNNKESIPQNPEDGSKVYQAVFTKKDWIRICDYAKKEKCPVRLEIYKYAHGEFQDTMVACLGTTRLKSKQLSRNYPVWRNVLQGTTYHYRIHPDCVRDAQAFIKSIKFPASEKWLQKVNVSFYRGSDIGHFDFLDTYTSRECHASFRLTEPSDVTIGTCYNVDLLQGMRFTGFNLNAPDLCSVIDCEDTDLLLLMPQHNELGYVSHVSEREVVCELIAV